MGAVTPPSAAPGQRNAPPDYPAESRRRGEEGVVRLALRIGSDGRVEGAEVTDSSGYAALDRAALEAVRRWRFRPASEAGIPVAATINTAVHFRLTEAERR
ncbi:energy transducer TonB [Roseomonas soli]|uniref:Energy transducer TonB n=2 Tax=Neoroseomonas soli TaxID=1081025 RepID=A0A9X9X4C8_9PROT|nr:energy transducer TonB [Neoroseomonas soli]